MKIKIKKTRITKMIIKTLVNNLIINKFRTPNEYKNSFSFAILLSYLNINVGNDAPIIAHYSSSILILSLIVLYSFTNIICYLSSIILLKFYKIGDKYPKLSRILSYFEKTTVIMIIIEVIIGYIVLLMIILFSFYILTNVS
uniref:Uncharacterized protein n=1 Tax=Tricholoma flavovirens TaxID=80606 RepID=A0A6C0W538_9AGAR|nr:hypothetical protein [Tricholoma flavovirens]QIC20260.1 hypothetical protein [Tricholoma flavovirens]